ncbi:MAG TPA: hypothetical protein PLD47_11905 [Aggregatilineales bacterium]|nr:haloacid dehalogenase [Anaerolineales bacterium]HRE48419.1 hypothetical protein [Aggregatilineales bacterium]
MLNLETITEAIRAALEAKHRAREAALNDSRTLARACANGIRAMHRQQWAEADRLLSEARTIFDGLRESLQPHPDLYHAGYTQDAAKEFVEARLTYALIRGGDLPTLEALRAEPATYLNGLCEAASELRRYVLDRLRENDYEQAEALLTKMDQVYDVIVTVDYPDAVSGGLRHRTDAFRAVLERTRGDVTLSVRQQRLIDALAKAETREEKA